MNTFYLILFIFYSNPLVLALEKTEQENTAHVEFDLIDATTKKVNKLFDSVDDNFETLLRNIAHAKALLILYWQQTAEANKRIPVNFKLKLINRWMNCSPWEEKLHDIPSQNISIVQRKRLIYLYDYGCVPDNFRDWCVEDPGRELSFSYIMEKRFGHSVRMEFICDQMIEPHKRASWGYGVVSAIVILTSVWMIRKYRERSNLKKTETPVETSEIQCIKQDPRFLTVPSCIRLKTEDSGKRLMAARKDFKEQRAFSVTIRSEHQPRTDFRKLEIPKIYIYHPDD